MTRIFRTPPFYMQGPGCLDLLGDKASTLGRNVIVIVDALVLPMIEGRLKETLRRQDIVPTIIAFDADVTHAQMDRLAGLARQAGGEVIVGVGGGRTLDTAKGVSRRLHAPFVSVPTAASTDAPATRGIVIYDDHHTMVAVEQMDENPAFVLADTALISAAPARFLRAGMGDALTAKFEAEGVWVGKGLSKQGTRPLKTGVLLANACYRMLIDHGPGAMTVAGTGAVNEDLECIIEAVLLLSAVAFENTGLSIAHAVATELGALDDVRKASLHGEHAAYGTLVQAVAEGRDAGEIDELAGFMASVGLPRTLGALGMQGDLAAGIAALAAASAKSPHMINQKSAVTAEDLAAVMLRLETS